MQGRNIKFLNLLLNEIYLEKYLYFYGVWVHIFTFWIWNWAFIFFWESEWEGLTYKEVEIFIWSTIPIVAESVKRT